MPKSSKKTVAKRSAGHAPAARKSALGKLPEWNLNDLYSGLDDPAIKRDLDRIDAECVAFETAYKGKLARWRQARTAVRRSPRRCGATRRSTI